MKKSRPRPGKGKSSASPAPGHPRTERETRSARRLALEILCDAERGVALERILDERLETSGLDARDRALVTHLVQGSIRRHRYLDWVLTSYSSRPIADLAPPVRNTLRLAAYQLLYMDRIPARAVVHEHVGLASVFGHRGTAGFVNAVLRSFLRAGRRIPPLPAGDAVARLAIETSHPDWLIRRWLDRFGAKEARELASANNRIPDLCVRVNRLVSTPEQACDRLRQAGIEVRPGLAIPDVLHLDRAPARVQDLPGFDEGWLQVQDESSALVGPLLAPDPGDRVVDLCSGVGGKTTHLAERIRDRGAIVAVDRALWRLRVLRSNCERLGITSVFPVRADVADPCVQPVDRVLLDAPCSGTGVLARRADARWRREEGDIARLSGLQKTMIRAASALVKPGGCLVYSVCSLEPEEGEDLVRGFLEEDGGFRLEHAGRWLPGSVVDGDGFLRTFPHRHGMDGMFGARMRKAGADRV